MSDKFLWVVNYDDLGSFIERAVAVKATGVAIRTDNDLRKAISEFEKQGIAVYGWRWPSAKRDAAMKEADKVADLLANGLAGYFVDPEGAKGKPWDWDQAGLEQLAEDFCKKIKSAAPNKVFGTTSHYRGKSAFRKLPWATFIKHSDVFLPQAYWRSTDGVIGHGIPDDNYRASLSFWKDTGAPIEKIVPMAGELAVTTASEIDAYVKEAKKQNINQLHFYTFGETVKDSVWSAVSRA